MSTIISYILHITVSWTFPRSSFHRSKINVLSGSFIFSSWSWIHVYILRLNDHVEFQNRWTFCFRVPEIIFQYGRTKGVSIVLSALLLLQCKYSILFTDDVNWHIIFSFVSEICQSVFWWCIIYIKGKWYWTMLRPPTWPNFGMREIYG